MSVSRTTTATSETSTLCGATAATTSNSGKAPLRAQGVRRFIRWVHSNTTDQRPTSTTPTPPQPPRLVIVGRPRQQRNGKKGPKRSMALTLVSFGKSMGLQVGLFLVLVAMSTLV
ncbi:hypothetical protein BGW39_002065 [Mortierella sp. 14UC]|nr:hypothetical protein BGW39_002065 [Mortierella sp. 14UC]